ncbi:sigma-54-dependent Fis family transcriptional regulator [Halalkalibacterium halodurans]|nr:sigma-54-dependent Fis family transcriptional regulator [Halalkalibacterium halodurans]MDY7222438.1 sigma-54-dependent Fis family transcriptional regulator [Halalkalibacterium halodurans]MDY7241659.1 sigma-54-dependent Fis family transcriptional regulator [Halalkalibacterium halodurans]MED4082254.1 sigma-54-dependent Fis family transcriptional regulator [Halalkalibacterium halodurans]MED4083595.1 sigma-54-dependent Fis family transcriptional regulator [Halalkalibacterium halodurans]MED41059
MIMDICDLYEHKFPVQITYVPLHSTQEHAVVTQELIDSIVKTGFPIFLAEKERVEDSHHHGEWILPIRLQLKVVGLLWVMFTSGKKIPFNEIEQVVAMIETYLSMEEKQRQYTVENRKLRQELKGFLEFEDKPLLLLDRQGIVTECSAGVQTVLGLNRSRLLGETIERLTSEKVKIDVTNVFKPSFQTVEMKLEGKREKWHVQIKPTYVQGEVVSFMIKFLKKETNQFKQSKDLLYSFQDIIGSSEAIHFAREMARRIAGQDITILLRGESGTGKEMFAQAVHRESQRAQGPFVAINCAAIPDNLLESELFGYESGAFTGAQRQGKAGRFELAHGGTIFLDEIGDMSLHLQAKLLRVLQERKVERVGGTQSVYVDVRIIAATHRNLEEMVQKKTFREDLYYRLNVIPITIPPVRERKEDLPILIEYFMKRLSNKEKKQPKYFSKDAYDLIFRYPWPGNVREIVNMVEHVIYLETGDLITADSLPAYLKIKEGKSTSQLQINVAPHGEESFKQQVLHLLDVYGRHTEGKKRIAKEMGISLPTLYRRLKKLKIR